MRKALRGFLNWLDRRFPERVVVTQVEYVGLKAKVEALEKALEKVTEARLARIEAEISKLNVEMGFGGGTVIPRGMAGQIRR
jgi:wobble nucleotide-excising tRNase